VGFGAVEKVWYEFAEVFARLGHAVVLIGKGEANAEVPGTSGVRILPLRGYSASNHLSLNLLKDFLYSIEVRRRIEPSDIVVTNSFWTPVLLSLFGRGLGKIVVHVARFPKGQMWLYRGVDALQVISSAVAREIVRQTPGVRDKVRVLPYPVDLNTYHSPEPARNYDGNLTVLYVGRVHPEKGMEMLIRAVRQVIERVPLMRVRIVGPAAVEQGGGGAAYLDMLRGAAFGLPVDFVGPIHDPKALAIEYARAHCFCYPSLAEKGEALGLAVLEAMATGLPVVVSDLACFRDFLEPGREGLVFDHRAEDAELRLAESLVQVLASPRLASRLGESAAARAQEFELEKIAKRYLDMFDTVARR
jgi:glycosyltransferase involved in cell wall biosynthesis